MKTNITILNALSYKNDKGEGTRLCYILSNKDQIVNNTSFKGFSELNSFYVGKDVFDKIDLDFIGKPIEATFGTKQDYKNPLKTTSVLESIVVNGRSIMLVQPKE